MEKRDENKFRGTDWLYGNRRANASGINNSEHVSGISKLVKYLVVINIHYKAINIAFMTLTRNSIPIYVKSVSYISN